MCVCVVIEKEKTKSCTKCFCLSDMVMSSNVFCGTHRFMSDYGWVAEEWKVRGQGTGLKMSEGF